MHNHHSLNSTREPKLTVYGGNIDFSGSISSSGENAVINIGSISTNRGYQQSTINKAASQDLESKVQGLEHISTNRGYQQSTINKAESQDLESEVQGLEQEEVFLCTFRDELLATT